MKRKSGVICMILGAVLITSALLLLLYNNAEDKNAGKAAEAVMPAVRNAILEKKEHKAVQLQDENEEDPFAGIAPAGEIDPDAMVTAVIDGYEYIGYLSIPVLKLELPIMSDWDDARLKIAPCRQFGSVARDNLVLAGHNYTRHFGKLGLLKVDDLLTFTDMEGEVVAYTVEFVGSVAEDDVDAVKNSEWDLVMYTCTLSGQSRIAVGCNRASAEDIEKMQSEK